MTLDIEAIEARANAATPGPWMVHRREIMSAGPTQRTRITLRAIGPRSAVPHGMVIVPGPCEETLSMNDDDADFIAHARVDIPALIARVRELEGALAEILELNQKGEALLDEAQCLWATMKVLVEARIAAATQAERERCVGIVRIALERWQHSLPGSMAVDEIRRAIESPNA